ncbi:MAG: glycosyltransferase [Armatimonadetes bacterium]|nr:glycosyltransferase [Armatimonadota bacterium]
MSRTNSRGIALRIAAIVPAYNEGHRLGSVLDAVLQASLVDEVVVVDDGSTDGTLAVAESYPDVKPIALQKNVGKGGAMYAGACSTDADIIVFLDADLIGITGEHIDSILTPVVGGDIEMCVGVFRGGRRLTDLAQIIAPYISGQRAMPRELFLEIPGIQAVRSGVEVALTKYFRANSLKMATVILTGCTHVMKEEKLGCIRGFTARLKMYYEISKIMLNGHKIAINRQGAENSIRELAGTSSEQQER